MEIFLQSLKSDKYQYRDNSKSDTFKESNQEKKQRRLKATTFQKSLEKKTILLS